MRTIGGRGLAVVVMALLCFVPLAAGYTWRHYAGEDASPTTTSLCPCSAIGGVARPLTTWEISGGGESPPVWVGNVGEYGALWAPDGMEEQYILCTITAVNESGPVINGYKCATGGANDDTITVDWNMQSIASGSASIKNAADPEWWWHPTVVVTDDKPVVQTKSGAGNWTDVAVDPDPDPDPETEENEFDVRLSGLYTWQNPTQTTATPLPDANNTMGRFLGSTTLPHAVSTLARVKVALHITVSGSGDNLKVTKWRVGVQAALVTYIG